MRKIIAANILQKPFTYWKTLLNVDIVVKLIKEIILYDDRIEIYYKHTDRQNPNESKTRQGFSFYMNKIDKFTLDNKVFTLNIEIICFL